MMAPKKQQVISHIFKLIIVIVVSASSSFSATSAQPVRSMKNLPSWQSASWHLLHNYRPLPQGGWSGKLRTGISQPYLTLEGDTSLRSEWSEWKRLSESGSILNISTAFRSGLIKKGDEAYSRLSSKWICAHWVRLEEYNELIGGSSTPVQVRKQFCPNLSQFLETFQSGKVELIFAGPLLDQPASAFGHLMLKLTPQHKDVREDGIVFTFAVAQVKGFAHALQLFFSEGVGDFTLRDWVDVKEHYTRTEQRPLWRYPLALNDRQKLKLLLAVWSRLHVRAVYQFHSENCITHVAQLLAFALRSEDISRGLGWPLFPSALLSALRHKNILGSPQFTPPSQVTKKALSQLSQDRRYSSELRHLLSIEAMLLEDEEVDQDERAEHLIKRSALSPLSQSDHQFLPVSFSTIIADPQFSAGVTKLRAGWLPVDDHLGFSLRWRGQDLSDHSDGVHLSTYAWELINIFGEIQLGSQMPQLRLTRLDCLKIVKLPRLNHFDTSLSWRLNIGPFSLSSNELLLGWTIGRGLEYRWSPSESGQDKYGKLVAWTRKPQQPDWSISFLSGPELTGGTGWEWKSEQRIQRISTKAEVMTRVTSLLKGILLYGDLSVSTRYFPWNRFWMGEIKARLSVSMIHWRSISILLEHLEQYHLSEKHRHTPDMERRTFMLSLVYQD